MSNPSDFGTPEPLNAFNLGDFTKAVKALHDDALRPSPNTVILHPTQVGPYNIMMDSASWTQGRNPIRERFKNAMRWVKYAKSEGDIPRSETWWWIRRELRKSTRKVLTPEAEAQLEACKDRKSL